MWYPAIPPKKVAIDIKLISIGRLNPNPEAKIPAVKSRLSPGKANIIPDSRKTITNTPIYP